MCPHCGGTTRLGRLEGKSTRLGTLKCYECRKPFTVKVGTIFEDSHVPLKFWSQVRCYTRYPRGNSGIGAGRLKTKDKKDLADQSARFIEAAKKTGADEGGKAFEKAFAKIVKKKTLPK